MNGVNTFQEIWSIVEQSITTFRYIISQFDGVLGITFEILIGISILMLGLKVVNGNIK